MRGPTGSKDKIEVDRLRVRALYRHSTTTLTVGLLNAGVAVAVLRPSAPLGPLATWCGLFFLTYLGRRSLQKKFTRQGLDGVAEFDPRRWETFFAIGTFLSGCLWGFFAVALIPSHSLALQSFIAFLLAGTTAGAAVAYSVSMFAILAFLLPATVPFAIRLAMEGTRVHAGMSVLLFFYVVGMGLSMKGLNKIVVESIRMRFFQGRLIRELKEAQDRLIQSAKMAALGEMAASIAHEINNPLSIIQFYATHLKESGLASPAVEMLDKIESTSSRMAKIVAGLRSFSRGDAMEAFQVTSLESIITETMELCRLREKKSRILLLVDQVPKDVKLNCRAIQISQILLNLLNNAFDAVEAVDEPWVGVEIKALPEAVSITVADNGPGIPREIREKIMQPFFTTKGAGKGTGLGLSIAAGIASAHGGRLRLDEHSDQTRFVLTLPRVVPASATEKAAS